MPEKRKKYDWKQNLEKSWRASLDVPKKENK